MKTKLLFAATSCLLLFSLVNFGQSPNLGTAANFVLFTTVGAVGNTGISRLTGNVGTNSGSSTGFGNVNGVMHDNDGASGIAAVDLLFAYNQLNAATPTFFPAPLLGNGDTLVAGVYKITAVSTLSSDLYLDAKGDANAVFIFQIEAAFSVNAASKIKLINGAQACNVFWKAEGLVSIASNAFIRGTVLAHNAAINMNPGDTLEGRAVAINGAISVNGVLAYTPAGCAVTLLTGPAAPVLATATCFAVFSANGSVTNSGITNVTGDIGTNVGLTAGFDALHVNGTIHPGPDVVTATAAADLLVAYNYLNLLPADIELLYPAQFGRNLVLTPHTYIMNGATTFTDSLYLDAQGSANAVFVIKIKGALLTSAFSKVLMINGTQAKNVFWVVDGAVGVNDYSVFNGTIICNNGAISLATGVVLNGRALTTGGAFSTAAVIATSPSGACAPLPVNWLYFRGKPVQKSILLEWATTNELNNRFFTIEKSADGQKFEKLVAVDVNKGAENNGHRYSFTDQQPFSLGYYRISQTDKDGTKRNYKTIQVKLSNMQGFAHSYVQQNYIYVQASAALPGNGSIEVYSMDGKRMATQKIVLSNEVTTYKVDKITSHGMYLVYVEYNGEKLSNEKVIVF